MGYGVFSWGMGGLRVERMQDQSEAARSCSSLTSCEEQRSHAAIGNKN